MDTNAIMILCDKVRQTAYDIHLYHGNGYLEKVYENALVSRLRKSGLNVQQQLPVDIFDEDGTRIGQYFIDILVDCCLLVELKVAKSLADEHKAQVLHYMKATKIEHALLINFGSYKFEIKKFARTLRNNEL
jgi:GxxExxY protein